MRIYRLAKRTAITDCPETGTDWTGRHPYPQDDGIPEFSPEHICGANSWAMFRHWWHDTAKLLAAVAEDHWVYVLDVPDKFVLVGRTQVMFKPEDAIHINTLGVTALHNHLQEIL